MIDYYYDKLLGADAWIEKEKIRNALYEFENAYKSKSSDALSGVNGSQSSSTSRNVEGNKSVLGSDCTHLIVPMDNIEEYLSEQCDGQNDKSDFDRYLADKLLPRNNDFDILTWWKTEGIRYGTLRLIARDIYAIPVSTVASEAVFSTSGRIVSKHRSRLIPDSLEALMCSQDWLWETMDDGASTSSFPPPSVSNGCDCFHL
ncbi:Zinc finger BED domain-containing protein DAYSLEEPER [Striga hermonthica]|uniref:Zinc finger BED domain-containing protein DAYSLEEPER n=1 Tax=Striga hermonthica TaxID=68872 RepID=A0A9N7NCL9_STRHE|nr:Zinc finger BED domain-containing protein DAYSLEEPER [Striga hermonthica]